MEPTQKHVQYTNNVEKRMCFELTSLLNGLIRATISGYLLTRLWYMSINSSGDFKIPAETSYFPLDWGGEKLSQLSSLGGQLYGF